jgi:MFS family permease
LSHAGRIAVLAVIASLSNGAVNGTRLQLTLHAIALDAGPLLVGLLTALYFVLPAVLSVWLGRWIDRGGYFRALIVGGMVPIVALLACAARPELWVLNVAMTAVGIGWGAYSLALHSAAALAGRPEQRITNFAWLTVGFSIGSTLGPLSVGFSIDAFGQRLTYLLFAGFNALMLVAVLWLRHALPQTRPVGGAARGRIADLFALPSLRRVIVIGIVISICWDAHTFLLPLYGSARGLSASTIGVVVGAFGVGAFVSRLAIPMLSRRISEWALLTATFVCCGVGYALLPFTGDATLLAILSAVIGVGLGLSSPVMMALLYAVSPPGRQMEVVGVRSTIANLIHVGLPLGAGALGAAFGIPAVIWAIGAMVLGTSGLSWAWRTKRAAAGAAEAR